MPPTLKEQILCTEIEQPLIRKANDGIFDGTFYFKNLKI
jgi:hypothetical protein